MGKQIIRALSPILDREASDSFSLVPPPSGQSAAWGACSVLVSFLNIKISSKAARGAFPSRSIGGVFLVLAAFPDVSNDTRAGRGVGRA